MSDNFMNQVEETKVAALSADGECSDCRSARSVSAHALQADSTDLPPDQPVPETTAVTDGLMGMA
ncbi:hypothetical protein [Rhodoligotrophos ferricapiens]|uniref:hypothetical protein n=1 Tax=Rhodoligotrophos ferricapiens TaxID=3069264 RepID=UPI00315D73D1